MIPTSIRFLFWEEVKNTIADLKDQEGLLHTIVTSAWKTEKLPCDWNIQPKKTAKKGDLNKCTNYRSITLHSIKKSNKNNL